MRDNRNMYYEEICEICFFLFFISFRIFPRNIPQKKKVFLNYETGQTTLMCVCTQSISDLGVGVCMTNFRT